MNNGLVMICFGPSSLELQLWSHITFGTMRVSYSDFDVFRRQFLHSDKSVGFFCQLCKNSISLPHSTPRARRSISSDFGCSVLLRTIASMKLFARCSLMVSVGLWSLKQQVKFRTSRPYSVMFAKCLFEFSHKPHSQIGCLVRWESILLWCGSGRSYTS